MPIVVSDTAPISALQHLGWLTLLPALFGKVLIPPAVWQELQDFPGGLDTRQLGFLLIVAPADTSAVQALLAHMHRGEAEAIALAQEKHAILLIDEHPGRVIAEGLRIKITGTIGILIETKQRDLIPAVMPLVMRLRDEFGFHVSDALLTKAKHDTGE